MPTASYTGLLWLTEEGQSIFPHRERYHMLHERGRKFRQLTQTRGSGVLRLNHDAVVLRLLARSRLLPRFAKNRPRGYLKHTWRMHHSEDTD